MKDDDKLIFTTAIAEHFPQATPGDVTLIWEQLANFQIATVKSAVERHRLELGAKVFRPDPNRLQQLCRSATGSSADCPAIQRTSQMLSQFRRDQEQAQRMREADEAFLATVEPDELERIYAELCEEIPTMAKLRRDNPALRAVLCHRARGAVTA